MLNHNDKWSGGSRFGAKQTGPLRSFSLPKTLKFSGSGSCRSLQ